MKRRIKLLERRIKLLNQRLILLRWASQQNETKR